MDKEYIEKEALKAQFAADGWLKEKLRTSAYCTATRLGYVKERTVEQVIDSVFPADVKPVVRGEWISWEEMFPDRQPVRKGLGVFCSVCKKHSDWPDEYCHRCGATMINSESYEDEEGND